MSNKLIIRSLIVLLMAVVLFGVVAPAVAEVNATKAFYVWDDNALSYKNSIADLFLDGSETHVLHEIGFDNDIYDPTVAGKPLKEMCDKVAALEFVPDTDPNYGAWRENCPVAANHITKFAGVMELGIPHIDNTNGAYAFAYSDDWSLIDCDLNRSNAWNNTDLDYNTLLNSPLSPEQGGYDPLTSPRLLENWDVQWDNAPTYTDPAPSLDQDFYFKILAIDVKTVCSSGNCLEELVTTIFFDLDIDKDDALTQAGDGVPVDATGGQEGGRTCFFARVYPINVNDLDPSSKTYNGGYPNVWTGNPQARITAGGGAKTVNFSLFGPTAITLEQLVAQSPGGINPFVWAAIFVLLTAIAFFLIRESRQQVYLRKDN